MPDAVTAITNALNSPVTVFGGHLAAGGVLAGIVWKCFERTENVLNEDTKKDIGDWLLGVKTAEKVQSWPDTFASVFDRVFGKRHLSWKCFWRSAIASYSAVFLVGVYQEPLGWLLSPDSLYDMIRYSLVGNVLPDYASLLETRYVLSFIQRTHSFQQRLIWLSLDCVLTSAMAVLTAHVILSYWWISADPSQWHWSISAIMGHPADFHQNHSWFSFVLPAFFTSVWIWLYVGSGLLLTAARRFDIGFQWFNSKADIEHKPLSAVGLVAGALVAMAYWAAVIVTRR